MTVDDRLAHRKSAALAPTIATLLIVPSMALGVHRNGGPPDLVTNVHPVLRLIVWFAVARRPWKELGFQGPPHSARW